MTGKGVLMTVNDLDNAVDLAARIGPVAAGEFHAAPEYAKPKLLEWINQLPTLSDAEFLAAARHAIYESALCSRFRLNFEHEHCRASACCHEATLRLVRAGHSADCRGPSLYSQAHAEVMRSHGYTPTPSGVCHCTLGDDNGR